MMRCFGDILTEEGRRVNKSFFEDINRLPDISERILKLPGDHPTGLACFKSTKVRATTSLLSSLIFEEQSIRMINGESNHP